MPQIEQKLLASAKKATGGFGYAPGCWQHVAELARRGAKQIEAEGLLNNEVKISIAIGNISRFVKEMKKEAHRLNLSEMYENTFAQALGNLCPLLPFCWLEVHKTALFKKTYWLEFLGKFQE